MKKTLLLLAALLLSAPAAMAQGIGNATIKHFAGVPSGGCSRNQLAIDDANGAMYDCLSGSWSAVASAGAGSVTSFSAGTLSPLFTTSVANPTLTPALSFSLSTAAQNSIFAGPAMGGAGAPSFQTAPTFSATNLTNFPTLNQNTTGSAGSAAKWTTARLLAGNSIDGSADIAFANKFIVQGTVDSGLSGAQFLGALGTGIVRNTTTTGVLSSSELSGDATTSGTNAVSVVKVNGSTPGGTCTNQLVISLDTSARPTCSSVLEAMFAFTNVTTANASAVQHGLAPKGDGVTTSYWGGDWTEHVLNNGNVSNSGTPTAGQAAEWTNATTIQGVTTTGGGANYVKANFTSPVVNQFACFDSNPILINCTAGMTPNAQTGTTYTIVTGDRGKYVSFSNASQVAVTLPQANSAGFASNFYFTTCDIGAGNVVITPTTSNISYSSPTNGTYTSATTSMTMGTGQCATITSDNSNYFAVLHAQGALTSAITYYVCAKANGGTCVYNGDAGTVAATIADTNDCLTKATPCRTIAGVQAKIANVPLRAVLTIQLANTAGTGTDCYQPNTVIFNNVATADPYQFWQHLDTGVTDTYATGRIDLLGNLTTPASVIVTGAATCAGTTPSVANMIDAVGTTMRVRGIQFQYQCAETCGQGFSGAITGQNAQLYLEDLNSVSDGEGVIAYVYRSNVRVGSSVGFNLTSTSLLVCANNSICQFGYTPLGRANLTQNLTVNTNSNALIMGCIENSHCQVDGASYALTGTGTGTIFNANGKGGIYWSDASTFTAPAQTWTINDANVVVETAFNQGYIEDAGRTVGSLSYTLTACLRYASATSGSYIQYITTGCTNPDVAASGGIISANGAFTRATYNVLNVATSDFTTANNTNLQTITGLSYKFPASQAQNIRFSCTGTFSQATAATVVTFGVQVSGVAPTNALINGLEQTSTATPNVETYGSLTGLASTTATNVVAGAALAATATKYMWKMDGFVEQPSSATAAALNIMVKTATGTDAVTVYRDSSCTVNVQ